VRQPLPSGADAAGDIGPDPAGAGPARAERAGPADGTAGTDADAAPTQTPRDDARADLWQRVRRGFALPDLDGDLVQRWEQWYSTRPDYVERMTQRGARYLFHIVEEVQKRGLPTELALLPFIESAFNPQALSVASASGIWQFMPATGRDFDLRQNLFRDDRRDVMASTRAALDYLESLHRMFGDWHLALAAYNWGQGNVQRALDNARRSGLQAGYPFLRMPDETRNYVPKLQAVKNIVLNPRQFQIELPALQNHPYFVAVEIDRDIDVALAARLAGMSVDDFQALNPQLNKPLVLAAGTPQLLLPYDNAEMFRDSLARHPGPWASWTAWVAPRTMRLAEAAQLSGFSVEQLRSLNRIPAGMMLRTGSTLLVPRTGRAQSDVSERVAEGAMLSLVPERQAQARRTIQASAKGEPLAQLARRHGVATAQLARWNGLPANAQLKPGQQLVVLSAPAPGVRAKQGPRAKSRETRQARQAQGARIKVAQAQPNSRR
jgi:membrane-bound lytic murein transglycosylase D